MKFSDFLKNRQNRLGFSTAKEHFEHLNGKDSNFDLRLFQAITSGTRNPTTEFFGWIFSQINDREKKQCLISYFNTKIKTDQNHCNSVIDYLKDTIDDIYYFKPDSSKERTAYTLNSTQVDFLSTSDEALLLWNKLTLFNKVSASNNISNDVINKMRSIGLVDLKSNQLICKDFNYIYPINSNPHTVKNIERIFIKNVEFFFSLLNKDLQIQTMRFAIIEKDLYGYIKDKMQSLNDIITKNTFRRQKSDGDQKIIFLSSFLRELKENEI